MLDPAAFLLLLQDQDISFFAGVPDSLLKNFLAYLLANVSESDHLICANEGSAVALACGYHLATGKIACVYMQNSGLGNAINPLMSIADPLVFKIPILLLIGFRGEPGISDEPQHLKQGAITERLLQTLEIPYELLDQHSDAAAILGRAMHSMRETGGAFALLVRKGAFSESASLPEQVQLLPDQELMSREDAIACIARLSPTNCLFVATTGKIGRELYEYRHANVHVQSERKSGDFYCLGGMGHASQVALGIARNSPQMTVVCLDGDGAALMHLGHLAAISADAPENLVHIILNNHVHESVGGQPTVCPATDFAGIASLLGYKKAVKINSVSELEAAVAGGADQAGPILLEVMVATGSRDNLTRPKDSPLEIKKQVTSLLQSRSLLS